MNIKYTIIRKVKDFLRINLKKQGPLMRTSKLGFFKC